MAILRELGIECAISVDTENQLLRAAQMTQKTNQFNLTTRRYDVTDLARFVHSSEHAVLMLEYRDRFGDEGSVALAIVDLAEGRIDTFLTSCRVIGRKVEDRLLDKAIELCRRAGTKGSSGNTSRRRKTSWSPTSMIPMVFSPWRISGWPQDVRKKDRCGTLRFKL